MEAMPTFEWKKCIDELEMYAPLLLKLVFHICRHRDSVNKQKKRDFHYPGVCMAIACIQEQRNVWHSEYTVFDDVQILLRKKGGDIHADAYIT